jgi:hypothetical protein
MSRHARPDPGRAAAPPRSATGLRVSPVVIFLAVALVGSAVYVLYAITVRDASQIPLLASGAVVLAIAFGALAVFCVRETWRAGIERRNGRALLLGLVGGGAAIAAAGCLAGAIVLFGLAAGP